MTILFNSKHSIKTQIGVTFAAISVVSIGICLAISLGFTATLSDSSYSTASDGITKQTTTNAAVDSQELAAAIAKDLAIIAESVCMVTSLQSTLFLAQVHEFGSGNYVLPFKTEDSFREYRFVEGCSYPDCPSDFGDLTSRSRLDNWNGSIEHSSVYLYSSIGGSLRSDSAWNDATSAFDFITPIINSLAYQDAPLKSLYTRGYNTSVFFYLSVQVGDESTPGGYVSIHRGYPGTERNTTGYDPPHRSWFIHAPLDAYYLDGPYKETFTSKYVLNLSSRKGISAQSGAYLSLPQPAVVVAASVMLLDSLAAIIRQNVYPNKGFGVLVKYDTLEVIVWRNESVDLYNAATGQFYTLTDLDPALGAHDVRQQGQFSYVDATGEKWLVASTPCLEHTDYLSGISSPALVMLVFSQWAVATSALPELHANIVHTTGQVNTSTSILSGAILAAMLFLVYLLVTWLTEPLSKMHHILAQIVARAAEDERHRDYSDIVAASWFDLNRSDELGYLATSFWHMVVQLHNATEAKKRRPKYPANPFHVPSAELLAAAAANNSTASAVSSVPSRMPEEAKAEELAAQVMAPDESRLVDAASFFFANETRQSNLARQVILEGPTTDTASSMASVEPAQPVASAALDGDILSKIRQSYAAVPSHAQVSASDIDMDGMELGATNSHPDRARPSAAYAPVASAVPAATPQVATAMNLPEKRTSRFFTLRVYLFTLAALLIVGLLAIMAATIYLLNQEGDGWTDQTGDLIETSEVLNLETIARAKSAFVTAYFKQETIDTQVLANAFTTLLDGNLTEGYEPFYRDALFLRSFSLDPTNFYRYALADPTASVDTTSGYFDKASAQCVSSTNCAPYQNSNLTRLSSMLDLQMESYMHAKSNLAFIQTGHQDAAYTRVLPYTYKSYGTPTSCFIEDRTLPECNANYLTSNCNPAVLSGSGSYPLYDARCRRWYQLAAQPSASTQEVYFDYPRVASTGDLVITTAIPIHHHGDNSAALEGVLNLNVLAATLSDSVNQFKIIDSGYVYVLDARNTSNAVLHPRLTTTCTTFRCSENGFSDTEFAEFSAAVLMPLQAAALSGAPHSVTSTKYVKSGEEWRFALSAVRYGTVDYVLIATVPLSDILKSSTAVKKQIDDSNTGIIIAASFTLFVFICLIIYATRLLVRGVAGPVSDLTALCENIMEGNLHSSNLPQEATSADMLQLLEAFSNVLTALRFGSDSYARGDIGVAKALFEEALVLYTASHNEKGIGACHNNLGAVHMSMGNHAEAQSHYDLAIQMAAAATVPSVPAAEVEVLDTNGKTGSSTTVHTSQISQETLRAAQKTLSDRRGNLALLYIAQERYPEAFALLESCMEEDRCNGYIRGCVVKQGNMGHLYMKQGEMKSAERVFLSALTFVYAEDSSLLLLSDSAWNTQEMVLARQIALFNVARLHEQALRFALAEHYYLLSLSQGEVAHLSTTTQTLSCVCTYLAVQTPARAAWGAKLEKLAETHRVTPQRSDRTAPRGVSGAKRVAFALDYSGSMAGSKIRTAVESLDDLFTQKLLSEDELMILKFNHICEVELPFTQKGGNEAAVSKRIRNLDKPNGGTALYDGIWRCVEALQDQSSSARFNNWVVVLTDGQNGSSQHKKDALERFLATASCGFVMIGVGEDVNESELQGLVHCAEKGFYLSATGDRNGIEKAFGQVAVLIQGQVMLEDL